MYRQTRLPIVAVVLGLLAAGSAAAQDTTWAMPTSLARVLAEAARDFRTGRPIYLVATLRFPQYVVGAFPTRARADSVAADSGAGYAAFGPYLTPRDSVGPDATTIDSIVLYLRTSGRSQRLKVSRNVDALFLTRSAVDKFQVPYYAYLYGPRFASLLRQWAINFGVPSCHVGGTIWCHPGPIFPPGGGFPPVPPPGERFPPIFPPSGPLSDSLGE